MTGVAEYNFKKITLLCQLLIHKFLALTEHLLRGKYYIDVGLIHVKVTYYGIGIKYSRRYRETYDRNRIKKNTESFLPCEFLFYSTKFLLLSPNHHLISCGQSDGVCIIWLG